MADGMAERGTMGGGAAGRPAADGAAAGGAAAAGSANRAGSAAASAPDGRRVEAVGRRDAGAPTALPERYDPEAVEAAAQAYWDEAETFRVTEDPSREKFYCLSMFPYPSGRLHMGHVRNYTIGDVVSRYQRMLGKNVLQPMGWDAFGLPAENAAIENRVPPAEWTYRNIADMKAQLRRLGFGYDWSREFATCTPEYYRWEQWMFGRMYEKGLAYRRNAEVNWDPVEGTVLANEQVIDGRGWRSGAPVERREIPHWFLKITDYVEELLSGLDRIGWPEAVKTMQRNWIGRSEGVEFDFEPAGGGDPITVFTTRPDTIYGATYMAVATGHPLAAEAAGESPAVAAFIEECRRTETSEASLETAEKQGIAIGRNAIHPMTGEEVPIWIANFVLMSYGTGAIMGVPAHDHRDHEFATRYALPIAPVIRPAGDGEAAPAAADGAFVEPGILTGSGEFDGLTSAAAFEAIADRLEAEGKGRRTVNYRLRDWGVSRQRYWGCPVPVITSEDRGELPVPEDQLPVVLPEDVDVSGGGSPLATLPDFVRATDPETGGPARRDTDTFDTFMESSWYHARFACPGCDTAMVDERANYWLPVDLYIGGIEHAILHLMYARFFHKVMRDEGFVESDEPFANLLTQGMVLNETFYREDGNGSAAYYSPAEVEMERDGKGRVVGARLRADGGPVTVGRLEKMSKSKNNGIDPETMVSRYGADTIRLYMMMQSPPSQTLEWSDTAVEGAFRFLRRLWRMVVDHAAAGPAPPGVAPEALGAEQRALRRKIHETIAKASDDVGRRHTFNTAIAAVIEMLNALRARNDDSPQGRAVHREGLRTAILLLAPVVPHAAHALWPALGGDGPVVDARWPEVDESALGRDTVTLVVQVNGKLRGRVEVPAGAGRAEAEAAARRDPNVARHLEGRAVRKLILVPDRLLNVVV